MGPFFNDEEDTTNDGGIPVDTTHKADSVFDTEEHDGGIPLPAVASEHKMDNVFDSTSDSQKTLKTNKAGFFSSADITDDDIKLIKDKYPSLSTDEIKSLVPQYGGTLENGNFLDTPRKLLADVGNITGIAPITNKLEQKFSGEEKASAMDDVAELVNRKKAYNKKVAEFAGGILIPVSSGANSVRKLAAVIEGPKAKEFLINQAEKIGAVLSSSIHGAAASKQGEELKGAAIGAVLPAGLFGAAKLGSAVSSKLEALGNSGVSNQVSQLTKDRTLDELIKEYTKPANAVAKVEEKLINNHELNPEELATIGGEKYLNILQKDQSTEETAREVLNLQTELKYQVESDIAKKLFKKPDADANDFRAYLDKVTSAEVPDEKALQAIENAHYDVTQDKILKRILDTGGEVRNLGTVENVLFTVADNKPVNTIIDNMYGSKTSITMDEASARQHQVQSALRGTQEEAIALHKLSSKEQDVNLIAQIEQGKITDPQAQQWKDIFDKDRQTMKTLGYEIKERKNYVPMMLKDTDNLKDALKLRLENYGPNDAELKQVLGRITNMDTIPTDTVPTLVEQIIQNDKKDWSSLSDLTAGITQQRDSFIPTWARETNLAKVHDKWVGQVSRDYALQDHLNELNRTIKLATFKGDTVTAARLQAQADDILGLRKDIPTEILQKFDKNLGSLENRIQKETDPIKKSLLKAQAEVPHILSSMSQTRYANLLSSPKAVVQNATSTITNGMPEVGLQEAAQLALKAGKDTVDLVAKGYTFKAQPTVALELGVPVGTEVVTHNPLLLARNYDIISKERGAAINRLDYKNHPIYDVIGKVNNAELYLFEKMDQVSRGNIVFQGLNISQKIQENPELLGKYVQNPRYRKYFQDMLNDKENFNPEEFDKKVVQWWNGVTLLNMDKIGASELRRRLGPFFGAFMKYPAYYTGRMAQPFYTKQTSAAVGDLAQKWLTPYLLFAAFDRATGVEDSPRGKVILGDSGLSSNAPIAGTTLSTLINPDRVVSNNPIGSAIKQGYYTGKSAIRAKDTNEVLEEFSKGAQKILIENGVGGAMIRLLEPVHTLVTGEEPKKKKKNEGVIEHSFDSVFD